MRTRVSVGAAAFGAAVAATGLAPSAQAEAVHFSYTAPASCPAEAALVEAVVRNGGHMAREAEALPARSFAVSVEEGRAITGHLAVRSLTGEEAVRTIQGARCEDVVSSLGVLVSLALDPDVAPPAAPEPALAPEPPASRAAEKDEATPKEPPGPLPFGWRFGASTEGSLGGLGTGIAAGLAAYVDLVHDVPDWSAFALRLGAEIAASGTGDNRTPRFSGRSGLERRVLRAEVCPARALVRQPWDASTIELWACARLDAGVVQASSGSLAPVDSAWLAPGPKVTVRWVTRHFFFELGGGLTFPLDRRLALDAEGDAYRVPGTLGVFGIGVGWFVL
jgi:hypothetical protein